MALLIPTGMTGDSKTPRAVFEVRYGQGAGNIGNAPRTVLLAGYKTDDSDLGDYEVFDILDPDEAIAAVGAGCELAGMIEVAAKTPGALGRMKGLAVPTPDGGEAGEATVTFTGTATAGGSITVHLDDYEVPLNLPTGTTAAQAATALAAAALGIYNRFYTAVADTAVTTFTTIDVGARSNDHVLWVDKRSAPQGLTVAIAGGDALNNGAVLFDGGSGTDTIASIIAATLDIRLDYSAWAMNEAAVIGDICDQAAVKASPNGVGAENPCFGINGPHDNNATAISLAANQVLAQIVRLEGLVPGSKLAAALAVTRMVTEALPVTSRWGNPNHRYDNDPLIGIPPHRRDQHSPGLSETDPDLNNGISPIVTLNGQAVICRAITTRHDNGGDPDYRTLDVGESMTPQRIREDLQLLWTQEHAPENPTVGPDLPNGDEAPAGRSTPIKWARDINGRLALAERENLLLNVAENQAQVEFNPTLKCLIANVPTVVTPLNHQVGVVIRQIPL